MESPVEISAHAILRYLERVAGIDLEKVKKMILPEDIAALAEAFGDGTYPVPGSHQVKVRDGTVVTVLGRGMRTGY